MLSSKYFQFIDSGLCHESRRGFRCHFMKNTGFKNILVECQIVCAQLVVHMLVRLPLEYQIMYVM